MDLVKSPKLIRVSYIFRPPLVDHLALYYVLRKHTMLWSFLQKGKKKKKNALLTC